MPLLFGLVFFAGFLIGVIAIDYDLNAKWTKKIIEGEVVVEEPEYAPPVVYSCKLLTTRDEKS